MKWLRRLSDAITYIEDNLTGEISYDEAAKIACCSTYYFQRMFSYVTDISLSEYIRRRRMTQAAFELQSMNAKVLDIALKYGYTSPTAFTRAFKSVHGIAPTVAKSQGNLLNAYPPVHFSVTVTGSNVMPYRIERKKTMRVVGIRLSMTEDMEKNKKIVPAFWQDALSGSLFKEICDLGNNNPHGILGISTYLSPKEIYYYIVTATDKAVPAGMFEFEIPEATWVVFENDGDFKDSVQNIFKRFLTEWLPFSGYEYAMLPDIEVYPIDKQKNMNGHAEVWISIRKIREGND